MKIFSIFSTRNIHSLIAYFKICDADNVRFKPLQLGNFILGFFSPMPFAKISSNFSVQIVRLLENWHA